MKIDVVIANPPYNRWKLHTKIANYIKLKTIKSVFIMPINVDIKYKAAEFLEKPFGDEIAWNNVFLLDMNGNINEYFSENNACFFKNTTVHKSKDPFYKICFENNKLTIKQFITDDEKYRWNCIIREEYTETIKKFLDWVNTQNNENINFIKKTFTPKHVSKYAINKLWEIYNENRHSDC